MLSLVLMHFARAVLDNARRERSCGAYFHLLGWAATPSEVETPGHPLRKGLNLHQET